MYLFTRNIDTKVKDNPFDDEGRKIKEKQDSLARTLANVVNVPLNSRSFAFENDEVIDPVMAVQDNNVGYAEFKNNDDISIGLEEQDRIFEELVDRLKNTYDEVASQDANTPIVEPVFESPLKEKFVPTEVKEEELIVAEQPTVLYNTYDYDNFNADDTYSEINEAQNSMASIRERAELAKRDAEESERILAKLAREYEETQMQLKEAEKRSRMVDHQLADTLMTKKTFLDQKRKQYENVINSSNQRTADNNSKIVEFRDLINSAEARRKEIDSKLARSEELLNTLSNTLSYEDVLNSYNDMEDKTRQAK